ncbi:MAG: DUF1707 SHOCT-like domain-containing protein [Acidimicrobiales bacterium]
MVVKEHRAGPDLRVSDAEREEVAGELGRHHAVGRLDSAELTERLERAYGARTRHELDAVVSDLPRAPSPPRALPAPAPRWRRAPLGLVIALVAVAGSVALGILTGRHVVWGAWWLLWAAWWVARPWRRRRYGRQMGRYRTPRG